MGLPGIRLSDLYGSQDYNNWLGDSTNRQLVESTISQYPNSDPELIKGHLYMNSKIKSEFGDEAFNNISGETSLSAKIDWYNQQLDSLEKEQKKQQNFSPFGLDTIGVRGYNTNIQAEEPDLTGANTVPKSKDGHAMYDWFQEQSNQQYIDYVEAQRNKNKQEGRSVIDPLAHLKSAYTSGETTQLEKQLAETKENNPEDVAGIKFLENAIKASREKDLQKEREYLEGAKQNIKDDLLIYDNLDTYKFQPAERGLWGSAKTQNTIEGLTSEIRAKMEDDPQFAFEAFEQFNRVSTESIPQYRNYHDTNAMPITPNEMKDIMANYYAIKSIKDINEANEYVQTTLQNKLADHQSILDKTGIALQGSVNNYVGNIVATTGMFLWSIEALKAAASDEYDIEGVNGFKEFLYYAMQNPLTQWANDLQTTGAWNPITQELYKTDEYNALQLQRRVGNETKFIDLNTPFELFEQGAYTLAGMTTGTVTAQLANAAIKRPVTQLATRMLTAEANGFTRIASEAVNTLGGAVATVAAGYLPAAAEASMDAMEKKDLIIQNAEQDILRGIDAELKADLEDGTFEEWYQQNSRLPLQMPPAEGWGPGELEEQMMLRNQEREFLWEQYRNMKVQEVLSDPEVRREIEQEAARTSAKVLFDEATWIATGDLFFNSLGKSYKALKQRTFMPSEAPKYKWVPEGNFYKAVARKPGFWQYTGAVLKGLGESAEEGLEEWFQTVDSQIREDIGHSYIEQYVANRYDPDALGQLSDSLRENWDVFNTSFGENALSEEALYSFLLGAVSSVGGSPTIVRGIKTTNAKRAKGQRGSIRDFWRNPIAEAIGDVNEKYISDQNEAADVNRWLQARPEVSTYNDETAILKFVADQQQALNKGDEATYRDALMGQKVATMLMMDRVNPNGLKLNFHAKIDALTKLNPTDQAAREQVNRVLEGTDVDFVRTTEGPLNENEVEVLNKVKQEAKDAQNLYKNLKTQVRILNSMFGNTVSTEAKEALAYGLIMRDNWTNRIQEITEAAKKSYTESNPDSPITPISQEEAAVMDAVARYGSLKGAQDELQALNQERALIRSRKRSMYRYEYKTALKNNAKQIREVNAARRLLSREELPVISASQILNLSNIPRAYLLDESTRKNYSEAQKAEIEKFINSEGIKGQTLTDLKDAGILENRRDAFIEEFNTLSANNGLLAPLFDAEVRARASETWSRAKLENVLNATTYEEFRDELDKALATGEFTANDKAQFSHIFNNPENPNKDSSKFFQEYQKEQLNRYRTRRIIENSPAFKSLSEKQQGIVSEAIEQQQLNGELTAESIIHTLNDPKFLEQTTGEELEQMAQAVLKAMEEKKNYDRNVAAEQARREALAAAKKGTPQQSMPGESKDQDTVINGSIYNKRKDYFDRIFKKIASIFTNNPQKLSREEFIDFISLYTQNGLSYDILGGDFETDLTLDNLLKIKAALSTALENLAYQDPTAAESNEQYRNTADLMAAIDQLYKIIQGSRKTSKPIDLNELIRNSITQVNPELKEDFKMRKVDPTLKGVKHIQFTTKKMNTYGTEAEKKWHTEHKITENIAKGAAFLKNNKAKGKCVFIKDEGLINAVKNELGVEEFNNDNLPLIVALRVTKDVEGAVQHDDGWYLYLGILQDSRPESGVQDVNDMNSLREAALQQEDFGTVKVKGKTYVSDGLKINYTPNESKPVTTNSLRDKLIADNGGDVNKAAEYFVNHFATVKTKIENGRAVGVAHWTDPTGTPQEFRIDFPTTNKNPEWKYPLYIVENPDGSYTPTLLEVNAIDEFEFDIEGIEQTKVVDILDNVSILDNKKFNKAPEMGLLVNAVNHVTTLIQGSEGIFAKRENTREAALEQLSKKVNTYLSKSLNLAQPARETPGIELKIEINDGNLEIKFYNKREDEDVKGTIISSIPISSLIPEGKIMPSTGSKEFRKQIGDFVQKGIRNLIYDEEGKIRQAQTGSNGEFYPIIKLQVSYSSADKESGGFNKEDAERYFKRNAWILTKGDILSQTPDSVETNPTLQDPKQLAKKKTREEAIAAITAPEFLDEHRGEHYQLDPGQIEVTTFIHPKSEGLEVESHNGKVATNLGTSVDKLYRVWRQSGSFEGVQQYIKEANEGRGLGSWPGITKFDLERMCKQFERIERFFADRDEVPVQADLIFKGNIVVDGKSHFFVGKPDIVTVDKNGMYHIYDMKSFRFAEGASAQPRGFKNTNFILNGLRNFEETAEGWRKQMSIYRVLMEMHFGEGSVSTEFGVIPVRLDYNPTGVKFGNVKEGVGSQEMTGVDGKPFHINFDSKHKLEKTPSGKSNEPITRCFDDAVKLDAILDITTINPDGWKTMSRADKLNQSFEEARKQTTEKETKEEQAPIVETGEAPPKGPSLETLSDKEVEDRIAGEDIEISFEEFNEDECKG